MQASVSQKFQAARKKKASRFRGSQQSGTTNCIWINAQIVAKSDSGCSLEELASMVAQNLPSMNLVNLTTSLHRMAKMVADNSGAQAYLSREVPVFQEVCEAIREKLAIAKAEDLKPQVLSNAAWALATTRHIDVSAILLIIERAQPILGRFKPFELSTALWAVAKLGKIDPEGFSVVPVKAFFEVAALHMMDQRAPMNFRCLSMTLWAFAAARQKHTQLFANFALLMTNAIAEADCQELVNTLWAFTTLRLEHTVLFTALGEKATLALQSCSPQEFSSMLVGFATSAFFHEGFFRAAAVAAWGKKLQPQHLANVFWAFSRACPLRDLNCQLMLSLLPECIRVASQFTTEDFSTAASALAQTFGNSISLSNAAPHKMSDGLLVAYFFDRVSHSAPLHLPSASINTLMHIVKAIAQIGTRGTHLLQIVSEEVLGRVHTTTPRDILQVLQGFLQAGSAGSSEAVATARCLALVLEARVEGLKRHHLRSLSRLCVEFGYMEYAQTHSRKELREGCLRMAGLSSRGDSLCKRQNAYIISTTSTQCSTEEEDMDSQADGDTESHGNEYARLASCTGHTCQGLRSISANPRRSSRSAVQKSFFCDDKGESECESFPREATLMGFQYTFSVSDETSDRLAPHVAYTSEDSRPAYTSEDSRPAYTSEDTSCSSAQSSNSTRLVVKNTFLQVEDEDVHSSLQRSHSEPLLCVQAWA